MFQLVYGLFGPVARTVLLREFGRAETFLLQSQKSWNQNHMDFHYYHWPCITSRIQNHTDFLIELRLSVQQIESAVAE